MKKSFSIIALATLIATSLLSLAPVATTYAETNSQPFTVKIDNPNSVRVKIDDPADKKQSSSKDLVVTYTSINIDEATLKVTNQATGVAESKTYNPASANEATSETFDLETLGGYGVYIISATGTKRGVLAPAEDLVSFTYSPTPIKDIVIDPSGAENPKIIFDQPIDPDVDHIEIQLYSEPDHTPMFNPAIVVPRSEIEDGEYVLPFNDNNIPTGDYKIEIAAYDKKDNLIYKTISDLFHYEAPIHVPNTGAFLKEIGLSTTSFALIITAVFLFLSIAFFIIIKQKKSKDEEEK